MHQTLSDIFGEEITPHDALNFEQFMRYLFELGEKYGIAEDPQSTNNDHESY